MEFLVWNHFDLLYECALISFSLIDHLIIYEISKDTKKITLLCSQLQPENDLTDFLLYQGPFS